MPRSAIQLDAGKRGLTMNFDHEELTLMMLYNTGTRLGLIPRVAAHAVLPDRPMKKYFVLPKDML